MTLYIYIFPIYSFYIYFIIVCFLSPVIRQSKILIK